MPIETILVFILLSVGAIFIDLYAHKDDKPLTLKSASLWSIFWILISIGFGGYLWWHHGSQVASLFFTGYALEKVLSVDNLFVMMAIFTFFKIPMEYRHRVLYYGILGAIVFRLIFVAIGTSLMSMSHWVELIFAFVVAWTAVMMLKKEEDDGSEHEDYSNHLAYKLVHKFFPVYPKLFGHNFFLHQKDIEELKEKGELELDSESKAKGFNLEKSKWIATPLFLCLAVVELSDVMFAFDSVPAVLAVVVGGGNLDASSGMGMFLTYSCMMFAILGLRTLYFVLEALKGYLIHLEKAVVFLLFFIAVKLGLNATDHIWHHGFGISANTSLIVVLIALTIGILASFVFPEKEKLEDTLVVNDNE